MNIMKKITAALLFLALVVAFAGCGNTPPADTTPSGSTPAESTPAETTRAIPVQNPEYPEIADIKPVYNTDLLTKEQIDTSLRLNAVVKEMINEDKYFGKNFDYLIESLTITGVRLKGQDVVAPASAFNTDYAPAESQTTVEIDYTATAVNKETGEKSVTSNTISYVVEGQEVANMATETTDYSALINAVTKATEEKLDQMADPTLPEPNTAEDKVEGRQSMINHIFIKTCFNERALELLYDSPYLKEYLDNGYTLTSIIENADQDPTSIKYRALGEIIEGKRKLLQDAFVFDTPYGEIEIQRMGGIFVKSRFITLAENSETGDTKLIVFTPIFTCYEFGNETFFNQCNEHLSNYMFVDIDKYHDSLQPNESMYYSGSINVAGTIALNKDFYNMYNSIITEMPYIRIQETTIQKTKIFDISSPNPEQQAWLAKIADTSNQNILVKTPD